MHLSNIPAKWLFILCMLFTFQPSNGSEYTSGKHNPPLTPEKRLNLATNMYNDFNKLRRAVPTLSPSQKSWLSSETKAAEEEKSAARYRSLWETSEYDLNIVNSNLDLIIYALSKIKKTTITKKEEVLHWSVISNILSNRDFFQSLHSLADKGLINDDLLEFINGTPDDLQLNVANSIAKSQSILSEIVIPYLDGRLPGDE